MQTVKNTLVLLISATLLGACGLKGPLYLPEDDLATVPVSESDSATEPAPEDDKEETEDKGKTTIPSN